MKESIKKHSDIEKGLKEKLLKIEDIIKSNEKNAVKVKLINEILGKLTDEFINIHHRSLTDQLTGFVNRWFLNEFLRKEMRLCRRYERDMVLALLDVDYLKQINDQFGHKAGDEALVKISEIIKKSIRSSDVVSRFGGDEFVIVFPMTKIKEARKVSERIRRLVSKEKIEDINFGVSIGLAEFSSEHKLAEDLIEEADKVLYEEKKKRT